MILDLFAGPGGWSEGLRLLGLSDFGIEKDATAAATRYAAGHATLVADLARLDPLTFADLSIDGLIGSPPCQAFSAAGTRAGLADERGQLVWVPMEWALTLRPRWVALEQVPEVLPIWRHVARVLERSGDYRTWTGILNAADFGVPQTRRRAVLIAHRDRPVAPPEPTHAEEPSDDMFGPALSRWITMAEALGWEFLDESSRPLVVNTRQKSLKGGQRTEDYKRSGDRPAPTLTVQAGAFWQWEKPATTICGDPRITARCHHEEGSQGANAKTTEQVRAGDYEGTEPIKLTIEEALILQSFRSDYPVQGGRGKQFEQIGNANPPRLAAAILRQVAL